MSNNYTVTNIIFYGIGGQGVISAAEVCALAAMNDGHHVTMSEVKGMSIRGGSVESYVRFGQRVMSPLPPRGQVDILVCLYAGEYGRLKDELKPNGVDLMPYLGRAVVAVGAQEIFLNVYMLGLVSSYLDIQESSWFNALDSRFGCDHQSNRSFFLQGRNALGAYRA